ncbi:MAG: winged helix-turn-helix transcriptional regulator [Anaerolineales bacterium]|nr:winged helix-turn-helix transcriptional regulator [Anaerolineales bacterium]
MSLQPSLYWDFGTAYDLFASLHVLHEPERFGLRASWAAGVRSRLPVDERTFLEKAQAAIRFPLGWIHQLPAPKDAQAVIQALSQLPVAERLASLSKGAGMPEAALEVVLSVGERGHWRPADLEALRRAYLDRPVAPRGRILEGMLDLWCQPGIFGERYLAGLKAYSDSFFSEEEHRIEPALQAGVRQVRKQTAGLALDDLIESLSHGIRFGTQLEIQELVLAPSYWISPLVVFERVSPQRTVILFGARPDDVSLVPGDQVPDGLLRALKALADPTRLRILRYLSEESLNPAELARRLRLRAPTLTHHLNTLRLAGLVVLTLEDGNERYYATRMESVAGTFETLNIFFHQGGAQDEETTNDSI